MVWLLLSTPVMPPSVACLQGDKSSSRLPPGGLSHPGASCLYFCSGKCFFSKISAGADQSWEACWALSLPAGSRGRSGMPGSSRLQGADAGALKKCSAPWFHRGRIRNPDTTSSGVWGAAESSCSCLVVTVDMCVESYVRK